MICSLQLMIAGGNLPLHHAVSHGKASVVEVLLQKGAWTEGSNSVDDTILHLAARKTADEESSKVPTIRGIQVQVPTVHKTHSRIHKMSASKSNIEQVLKMCVGSKY